MSDKCIVHKCSNRKGQGTFVGDICLPCWTYLLTGMIGPTNSFLGEIEKLRQLLKDTWMMMEHATRIDFSNGITHAGQDEGNVRGWEMYENLRKKVKELGLL